MDPRDRDREREPTDDELREEDVTLGDRLDDRVSEADELPEGDEEQPGD